MANDTVLPRRGSKSIIEIQNSEGNWLKLVGISSIDESGGEAQTNTVDYLDESQTSTGNPGVPTFSITIDAAATTHPGWADFIEAGEDGLTKSFRITMGVASEIAKGKATTNLVAVATTGLATFSGNPISGVIDLSGASFAPGMVLNISSGTGAGDYVVNTITAQSGSTPVRTCNVLPAPGSAVAATEDWSLRNPQTRRVFSASIGSFPTLSVNSQQITGTATIIPTAYSKETIVAA